MKRKILFGALTVVALLAAFIGWTFSQMPPRGAARIEAAPGIVGVETGGAYVWLIRTPHGVALIDAGMDKTGKALLAELGAEHVAPADVNTILITHGHRDHIGALAQFPNAKVWIDRADEPIMRGEGKPKALLPRIFSHLMSPPPLPAHVEDLHSVDKIEADGQEIGVLHTPGHTAGSTMFLYKKVLFTGDSLFGNKGKLMYPPAFICDDIAENHASVRKLSGLDFDRIADGHAGVTTDAHEKCTQLFSQ